MVFNEDGFKDYLSTRGLASKSQEDYLSAVRSFYDWIETKQVKSEEDFIDLMADYIVLKMRRWNIRFGIKYYLEFVGKKDIYNKMYDKHKRRFKMLARRQERKSVPFKVITSIANDLDMPYKLIFMLQYDTALRISDVLKLRYNNLDIDDDGMVKLYIKEKKTGKIRALFITKQTAILTAKMVKALNLKPEDRLFVTCRMSYNRALHKVGKIYGYPEMSSHWVRASKAVHLFNKGYDIKTVQRILAHSKITTTEIYIREAGKDSKEIIKEASPDWN